MLTVLWPAHWSRSQRSNATLVTALLLMVLVVSLLGQLLSLLPEPIGSNADTFAEGARTTLYLTLVSGAAGLVLGIAAALARTSRTAALRWAAGFYVWAIRGTPLLVQILFIYFALPVLIPGLNLPDFAAACIALALNVGAYNAEAVRAGLQAVPRGQWNAASALGMRRGQQLRLVVLPQALRVIIPPYTNLALSTIKNSSLAVAIGYPDVVMVANTAMSQTGQAIECVTIIAVVYLAINLLTSLALNAFNQRSAFITR